MKHYLIITYSIAISICVGLVLILFYQHVVNPFREIQVEATVREIRIADAKDFTEFRAPYPGRWERFVVGFDVTRVLKGRSSKRKLDVIVHSPSADLGVRRVGQRVVLRGPPWDRVVFDPS